MLVLRRKAGEAIVLNGVITIYVLAVEGERVKLGISAPPEVVIVRSELLDNPSGVPGGPMSAPATGPLGARPGGQMDASPDYGRGPRPPERPYREPERPYREPEPPTRLPDGGSSSSGPDQSGSYSVPARYTPRRRYDNYGEEPGAPISGPHDTTRYR
ncbi:MAG TPA: carbon storage regulator [Ktedonobacterales bacterium]|jgi:carbon storage regulator|nr:carbon storage regulator [Ktedonobacterales bacterium]